IEPSPAVATSNSISIQKSARPKNTTTTAAAGAAASEPHDDFAALIPLANDCFTFIKKQPEFIVSEIRGGGVPKMLLPATMEDRSQLDASRARIKRLRDRVADYEARIRRSASDLTAKVNASKAPE